MWNAAVDGKEGGGERRMLFPRLQSSQNFQESENSRFPPGLLDE